MEQWYGIPGAYFARKSTQREKDNRTKMRTHTWPGVCACLQSSNLLGDESEGIAI